MRTFLGTAGMRLVVAAWASLSLTLSVLPAQDPGANGLEIVELKGKLEMILGNQIKMKTEDGQEAIVLVTDATTFTYRGTAEPTALGPGLLVRFNESFDAAGQPQGPVSALEIFRPIRMRRPTAELQQKQTPGIHPVSDKGKDDVADRRAAGKPNRGQPAKPAAKVAPRNTAPQTVDARNKPANARGDNTAGPTGAVQDYLVVGMLRGIQGDKMQVVAGNRPVIVPIARDLKISVTAGDPLFCQPGDTIEMTGLKNPAGLVQADVIDVTGAKPLGSVDEKDQRQNRAAKGGKDGDAKATDAKDSDKAQAAKAGDNKTKPK